MHATAAATPPRCRTVRWAGAAAFALSLAWFVYRYFGPFGRIRPGPPRASSVAVNLALFALFAAHHSAFARLGVRAWMARHVHPALERSVYVWTSSVLFFGVCSLWQPVGGVAWSVAGPGAWLLRTASAAGLWLSIRSAAMIDVWELAGVRPPPVRPAAIAFRTDGPYGWIRHPIYLGWCITVFSATPMTMTRLVFAIVSCAYVLAAIPLEERTLRSASASAYDDYTRQVRWRLVPGLF